MSHNFQSIVDQLRTFTTLDWEALVDLLEHDGLTAMSRAIDGLIGEDDDDARFAEDVDLEERNAALRERVKELEADLAKALAPAVKAAA